MFDDHMNIKSCAVRYSPAPVFLDCLYMSTPKSRNSEEWYCIIKLIKRNRMRLAPKYSSYEMQMPMTTISAISSAVITRQAMSMPLRLTSSGDDGAMNVTLTVVARNEEPSKVLFGRWMTPAPNNTDPLTRGNLFPC